MNCDEIQTLIHSYIDGELEDTSDLKNHLANCSSCRLEYEFILDMIQKINQIEFLEVPSTLHTAIMNQIEIQASKKRSTSFKHNLKSLISVVAAAFLLVVVFAVIQPNHFFEKTTERMMMDTASYSTADDVSTESSDMMGAFETEETVESSRATGALSLEDSSSDTDEPVADLPSNIELDSSMTMGIMENDLVNESPSVDQKSEEDTIEFEITEYGVLDEDATVFTGNSTTTDTALEDSKLKEALIDPIDDQEKSFNWLLILIPGIVVVLIVIIIGMKFIPRTKKTKQ